MTERPQDERRPAPSAFEDPTRDIRLPAMADRPPAAMPRAWAGLTHAPASDAPSPDFSAPPPEVAPPTESTTAGALAAQPERPRATSPADHPTDELSRPQQQPRERTLAFSAPEMSQRPAGPVHVARTPRRWPWILLALVPLLIIAGTGIALVLLFQAG